MESGQRQGSLHRGDTVVRRAYGRWTEQGFSELVQGRGRELRPVPLQPTISTDHRSALLGVASPPLPPPNKWTCVVALTLNQNMMY